MTLGSQTRWVVGDPREREYLDIIQDGAFSGLYRGLLPPAARRRVLRPRSRCSKTRAASADFCSLDTKLSTSSNTWFRISCHTQEGQEWWCSCVSDSGVGPGRLSEALGTPMSGLAHSWSSGWSIPKTPTTLVELSPTLEPSTLSHL